MKSLINHVRQMQTKKDLTRATLIYISKHPHFMNKVFIHLPFITRSLNKCETSVHNKQKNQLFIVSSV
jgi:hypothetical protein